MRSFDKSIKLMPKHLMKSFRLRGRDRVVVDHSFRFGAEITIEAEKEGGRLGQKILCSDNASLMCGEATR